MIPGRIAVVTGRPATSDLQAAADAFYDAGSVGIGALCDRARWMGQSAADSAAYREAERAAGATLTADPAGAVIDDQTVAPP